MLREHQSCLFNSVPIIDCGRDMRVPEPVLASSWPLAVLFAVIAGLAVYAYLRTIYPHETDQSQGNADWDVGSDEHPTIEIQARRAGE